MFGVGLGGKVVGFAYVGIVMVCEVGALPEHMPFIRLLGTTELALMLLCGTQVGLCPPGLWPYCSSGYSHMQASLARLFVLDVPPIMFLYHGEVNSILHPLSMSMF